MRADAVSGAAAALPARRLLAALQFGDSFFPGGGAAFSWGLESMQADGLVRGAQEVQRIIEATLERRWGGIDRPFLRAAHSAWLDAPDEGAALDRVLALDGLYEASVPGCGSRAASRKLGGTQLRVHAALGLHAAGLLRDAVHAGRGQGHLAVVQGVVWAARGLACTDGEAMSAYGTASAIASAAIRLGLIGHLDAQRVLAAAGERIGELLAHEPVDPEDAFSGEPLLDIAAMRHEHRRARLFAN